MTVETFYLVEAVNLLLVGYAIFRRPRLSHTNVHLDAPQGTVQMYCNHCGLLVARYDVDPQGIITCKNCED